MTEAEWLASTDLPRMLAFVLPRTSQRKQRLWSCACVRRVWNRIPHELGQRAIEVNERFADDAATELELLRVADAFAPCGLYNSAFGHPAMRAAHASLYLEFEHARHASHYAMLARKRAEREAERNAQIELLRHIIGNPFRSQYKPLWQTGKPSVPPLVKVESSPTLTALAESLYAGQDCGFALHDALLDAGHADLAEHFRAETSHPRGCWALDHILGRE